MPKIQAKVILAKCPYARSQSENLFGMRSQNIGGEWKRTWAFKIDEEKAGHEGYGKERMSGSFDNTDEYPGCPYCKGTRLARCSCEKVFCGSYNDNVLTCPWCGETTEYESVETLDLQGGGI